MPVSGAVDWAYIPQRRPDRQRFSPLYYPAAGEYIRMSKERAAATRFCDGFSCSQAILSTYGPRYGLEEEQALRLASGLGGGMGRMGRTCGAVTGAFLVIGLDQGATSTSDKAAKERTYGSVREFADRFQERNGSTYCRELLECDISDPEEYARAQKEGLFKSRCPRLVQSASELLEELL
jgi:C_GCAxxG_C_C family probable redox protein